MYAEKEKKWGHFFWGKGLEKVYLLAVGLDRVRKVPKNAETAKNTIGTVFSPSFLHASLVGGFGARPSKKTGKNHVTTDIQPRANGRLASRKRRPFLGPEFSRYT